MRNVNQSSKNRWYAESHTITSVEEYSSDIDKILLNKRRFIHGLEDSWILKNVSLNPGYEIGLSPKNNDNYLTLTVERGGKELILKMGGAFGKHIRLVKQKAENLLNSEIIWHTWNDATSDWDEDKWFYRIEPKSSII
jgi:hypothetical protein